MSDKKNVIYYIVIWFSTFMLGALVTLIALISTGKITYDDINEILFQKTVTAEPSYYIEAYNPSQTTPGGVVTVRWNTFPLATSCQLDGFVDSLANNGSIDIIAPYQADQYSYVLHCTWPDGTKKEIVISFIVIPAPTSIPTDEAELIPVSYGHVLVNVIPASNGYKPFGQTYESFAGQYVYTGEVVNVYGLEYKTVKPVNADTDLVTIDLELPTYVAVEKYCKDQPEPVVINIDGGFKVIEICGAPSEGTGIEQSTFACPTSPSDYQNKNMDVLWVVDQGNLGMWFRLFDGEMWNQGWDQVNVGSGSSYFYTLADGGKLELLPCQLGEDVQIFYKIHKP